jgi:CheY-like chemotaxis protein/HPt (histidine-containing phosphotransfer) domain-containing protein
VTEETDGGISDRPLVPSAGTLGILVVDDDDLNRSMISIMLTQQGYPADFATNGAEALAAVQRRKYDLIFMDLMLPDMNGRDVARRIREWEDGRFRVPIVALTAYDLPGQPLELLKAGMDDYLFKPYNGRQLARMIRLYTGAEAQEQSAAAAPGERVPIADSEAAVLDYESALEDLSNNMEDYTSLLGDFIASLPGRLGRMQEDYRTAAFQELARECHNLKSISAGLGAAQLSRYVTQLEKLANPHDVPAAGEMLEQVGKRVEYLQSAAEAFLNSANQGT